jgi:hypothetical protein
MDEEEKPFPIEFIIILLIVAVANDVAEVFFDLLDFTGVGVAGEAIMEPANFVLDFFFTGIFWWKVGPGGGTITQYIGDILEPFLIPGRTISVGLGMWIANHPNSAIGKVAMTAAVGVATGGVGAVATEGLEAGAVAAEGAEAAATAAETTGVAAEGAGAVGEAGEASAKVGAEDEGAKTAAEGVEKAEGGVDLEPEEEKNPMENLGKNLNQPPEEEFHEGEGAKREESKNEGGAPEEEGKTTEHLKKVFDIADRTNKSQNRDEDEDDEELPMAA